MLGICKGVYIHSRPTASPVDPTCVQGTANTTAPTCVQLVFRLLLLLLLQQHHLCLYVYVLYVYMYVRMSKSWAPYFVVIDTYYYYYYIIYFDVLDTAIITNITPTILKHTLSYIIVFTHARSIICRSCALDIISYFIILLFYIQH